jgi:hypothetical protein
MQCDCRTEVIEAVYRRSIALVTTVNAVDGQSDRVCKISAGPHPLQAQTLCRRLKYLSEADLACITVDRSLLSLAMTTKIPCHVAMMQSTAGTHQEIES